MAAQLPAKNSMQCLTSHRERTLPDRRGVNGPSHACAGTDGFEVINLIAYHLAFIQGVY